MKVAKCPQKCGCFDYGNCEDCCVGDYVIKTEKKIKRLREKLKKAQSQLKGDKQNEYKG